MVAAHKKRLRKPPIASSLSVSMPDVSQDPASYDVQTTFQQFVETPFPPLLSNPAGTSAAKDKWVRQCIPHMCTVLHYTCWLEPGSHWISITVYYYYVCAVLMMILGRKRRTPPLDLSSTLTRRLSWLVSTLSRLPMVGHTHSPSATVAPVCHPHSLQQTLYLLPHQQPLSIHLLASHQGNSIQVYLQVTMYMYMHFTCIFVFITHANLASITRITVYMCNVCTYMLL